MITFVRFGFFEVFQAFFYMFWDISLKYVYTCSRWCYTSSSSFIPIRTLWPTLQPEIGQSHLSAFMSLKIIKRPQIWYTHLYCECLDPYWFSSWLGNFWPSGGQKHLKGGVTRAPSQCKVFQTLFVHVVRYQFETWNWIEIELKNWIWYTHSNSECLDPYWLLSCLGNFWPSGGQKHCKGLVELVELPASDTWSLSFIRIRSLPLKSFLDFLPEASFGLRVLSLPACVCVCLCVCVSVNHELVRAIIHQPFKLGSLNLNQRCKRPWLRALLFSGAIDLDLQGQIKL